MNSSIPHKNNNICDDNYFRKAYNYSNHPITSLIASNKLQKIDAAAIFGIDPNIVQQSMLTVKDFTRIVLGDMPIIFSISHTGLGRLACIAVPILNNELYSRNDYLKDQIYNAIQIASFYGAKSVSLTGLLPSATKYGENIIKLFNNKSTCNDIQITTGHAVTISAVVLQVQNILSKVNRSIADESICILGLGSIGSGVLELLMSSCSHPKTLTLCDLFRNESDIKRYKDLIKNKYKFQGRLKVISNTGTTNNEIYNHSLILGATSQDNVLDVSKLIPGTIIIDDSAPHCFNSEDALERINNHADILTAEAGLITLSNPAHRLVWNPFHVDEELLKPSELEPRTIMGCEYSALLTQKISSIKPTIGKVDAALCLDTYKNLISLGISSGPVRLDNHAYTTSYINNFAKFATYAA